VNELEFLFEEEIVSLKEDYIVHYSRCLNELFLSKPTLEQTRSMYNNFNNYLKMLNIMPMSTLGILRAINEYENYIINGAKQ